MSKIKSDKKKIVLKINLTKITKVWFIRLYTVEWVVSTYNEWLKNCFWNSKIEEKKELEIILIHFSISSYLTSKQYI